MNPAAVSVIIPALDEAQAIPEVLADLARLGLLPSTVVVDNGSRDGTGDIARRMGARVEHEPERGYGAACLRGLEVMDRDLPGEVVVFMDADRSDDPDWCWAPGHMDGSNRAPSSPINGLEIF